MPTVTYDLSNCPCCGGTVTCECCSSDPSVLATFVLPSLTPAAGGCDICSEHSGQSRTCRADAPGVGPCEWFGDDECGTGVDAQFIFWRFQLTCVGADVIANAEVNVSDTGGSSDTVWQKNLGAKPIDCSGLSVTFATADVVGSDSAGPCDVGDDLTVTLGTP
jgi:hypothetical protein